jgi:hypothetical protein
VKELRYRLYLTGWLLATRLTNGARALEWWLLGRMQRATGLRGWGQ